MPSPRAVPPPGLSPAEQAAAIARDVARIRWQLDAIRDGADRLSVPVALPVILARYVAKIAAAVEQLATLVRDYIVRDEWDGR
jgi:hypothetical protein